MNNTNTTTIHGTYDINVFSKPVAVQSYKFFTGDVFICGDRIMQLPRGWDSFLVMVIVPKHEI